jgi:hypothetical protein
MGERKARMIGTLIITWSSTFIAGVDTTSPSGGRVDPFCPSAGSMAASQVPHQLRTSVSWLAADQTLSPIHEVIRGYSTPPVRNLEIGKESISHFTLAFRKNLLWENTIHIALPGPWHHHLMIALVTYPFRGAASTTKTPAAQCSSPEPMKAVQQQQPPAYKTY